MSDPNRNVIAAMIEEAIADLKRKRDPKARAKAAIWFASQAATGWLLWLDLDQARVLRAIGWPNHAREVLSNGAELTDQERAVLRRGLEELA